ncbi:dihydroxyacetone kinase subunit DhaL [Halalkalibacter krulwichiae]|uniref:phosphoenolpyruvate--glycerone phosphotransferase n=1 Tax=Halalkalibacter krulwichiae TaxID=199441 RepID=A0A1X9MHX5_9BACI|nr:dihydroxyacetone kinase subunit DhaL [Halalkalibacter krulwichiae]ARK30132.1 PTS-dependent dihydroxyacetone kinase, ADP-binding subunit DhaL [Halalkalibacter krulwichiae]
MEETLTIDDFKGIFTIISGLMDEKRDYLCQLDGALGDGDIGLTMSKGFRGIKKHLSDFQENDIGVLLMQSGLEMANNAASTMGTLVATALMRAGKVSQGKSECTIADISIAFNAMVEGIKDRGKAQVGDKTILDSLSPAAKAIEEANANGLTLKEAVSNASKAAEKGMSETVYMQSQHGRAGRYLEKSIGHQDPGATVGAYFVKGFEEYIYNISE